MTPSSGIAALIDGFDVVGTMWVNAIRMTVIPLIVPLLIGLIAGAKSIRDAGRLGLSTIGAFAALVAILAVIAALTAPLLFSGLYIDLAMTAALRTSVADTVLPTSDASIGGWLKALADLAITAILATDVKRDRFGSQGQDFQRAALSQLDRYRGQLAGFDFEIKVIARIPERA